MIISLHCKAGSRIHSRGERGPSSCDCAGHGVGLPKDEDGGGSRTGEVGEAAGSSAYPTPHCANRWDPQGRRRRVSSAASGNEGRSGIAGCRETIVDGDRRQADRHSFYREGGFYRERGAVPDGGGHRRRRQLPPHGHRGSVARWPGRGDRAASAGGEDGTGHLSPRPVGRRACRRQSPSSATTGKCSIFTR